MVDYLDQSYPQVILGVLDNIITTVPLKWTNRSLN